MRESRPAFVAGRLPDCHFAGDNSAHSTSALRLQFLGRFGVSGRLAEQVASAFWGEAA
jgi:hypothetical protein